MADGWWLMAMVDGNIAISHYHQP